MVPKGWKEGIIEDIAKVSSGGTPSRNEKSYWDGGSIPWIRTTEVQNCVLNYEDTQEFITRKGLEGSSAKLVPSGTLLMAMIGQGKTRGQVALLNFEATTNQNCATILLKKNNSSEFYFNYLLSKYERIRNWSNSAGQSNLSGALVKSIPVMIPPFQEQQKIAKILSTWDKAISTTERLIENSTQQKKALMQQLLTGKKRLLDESGEQFEGTWKDATVSSFGKVVTGSTPPKNDSSNYDGNISWATAEDFKRKYVSNTKVKLTESGAAKARVVPKGSVLVTCIASIGKNAIANENLATNQQINSVVINKNNSNEFFYYLIEFNTHKLLAWAGTTAVPILNKTSFEKVKFVVPNLKEQQKIATVLTNADKEIELLEQQLADLQQEKKALMQVLLTGKKRVVVDGEV